MRKRFVAGLIATLGPLSAGSQVVTGTVVDSATRLPIAGVSILVTDVADSLNRRALASDEQGRFAVKVAKPGSYSVMARRLGLAPAYASVVLADAAASRTVRFEMNRIATVLDTVRAVGEKEDLTRGKEWFARHFRDGKGFFTSGLEILMSRQNSCEYFANIPGLQMVQGTRLRGESMIPCFGGRAVTMATRPSCFQTVVDRRQGSVRLDSTTVMFSQARFGTRYIKLEEIRGVEVYRDRVELPPGDDDLSIPIANAPRATTARRTPSQRTMGVGPSVRLPNAVSLKCATVVIWTNATW